MKLILIGVFLLLIAVFKKKSKPVYGMQMLYLWAVAAFNTYNLDYFNYWNGYVNSETYRGSISEPSFRLLVRICSRLGLDFQLFRCVFFAIAIMFIGYGIWKIAVCPNWILGIYFLYPFALDVIQMRSMMANGLILCSIYNLLRFVTSRERKNFLVCFALLVLATSFHYSAVVWFVMFLALVDFKERRRLSAGVVVMVLLALGAMVAFRSDIARILNEKGVVEKASFYLDNYRTRIGGYAIIVFLSRWLLVGLAYLAVRGPKKDSFVYVSDEWRISKVIMRCLLFTTFFSFAELFVSMELERLTRVTTLLGYCLLTQSASYSRKDHRSITLLAMVLYLSVEFYIMMFLHYGETGHWFDVTFKQVFYNNLF